jgi:hypothetical protein
MGNFGTWVVALIKEEPFKTGLPFAAGIVVTKLSALRKFDSDRHKTREDSLCKIIAGLEEYDGVLERLLPLNKYRSVNNRGVISSNKPLNPIQQLYFDNEQSRVPLIADAKRIEASLTLCSAQYGKLPKNSKGIDGESLSHLLAWCVSMSLSDLEEDDNERMQYSRRSISKTIRDLRVLLTFEQEQSRTVIGFKNPFVRRKSLDLPRLLEAKEDAEFREECWQEEDRLRREEWQKMKEQQALAKANLQSPSEEPAVVQTGR